jgi:hypothetical protein
MLAVEYKKDGSIATNLPGINTPAIMARKC